MTDPLPSDRQLAIGYAPASVRAGFAAMLALDARLAGIVRTTREPLVGQMRLTWWHDALVRLDIAPAPAEPVLRDLQAAALPHGVTGADLATLVEGWEVLLDPLDADGLASHAERRGARLFRLVARLMDGDADGVSAAGRGWALADLALHVSAPRIADIAMSQAREAFATGFAKTWPRSIRPLGALALFQLLRIDGTTPVHDFARMTRFQIAGR
ncbi:squalene/phytoene synthase family protein [Sphingomonas sp. RP10(2022)]|uniref:Squalene/phytoene synthase family protein n=1 Tax=Sphingomonas liriopis TaxID=2949094 RepID=A0A9X2KTX4_9SPHN|nr:squalene/phytoene synthase family protein [Sphingomonas liriopis]MCP3735358.1 squalene/phytoene synthase family protein [Sphingomonas liriopis]